MHPSASDMTNHPPPREGGPERALDVSEPVPSPKSPEGGEPNDDDGQDGNAEGCPPPGCPKDAHDDELCGMVVLQSKALTECWCWEH